MINMGLLENKKPQLKNWGNFCGSHKSFEVCKSHNNCKELISDNQEYFYGKMRK